VVVLVVMGIVAAKVIVAKATFLVVLPVVCVMKSALPPADVLVRKQVVVVRMKNVVSPRLGLLVVTN
tara:strand:+ start:610 stop:810 length:201 start_codon:yes stop_codon:yes gene_type:complete